jgi:CubicO group peptidase (beta-lactamase class C family)
MKPYLTLTLLLTACGVGKHRQPERAAAPDAGSPTDIAADGQTACAASTRSWPDSASLDATIRDRMEAGHLPGLSACIIKDGDVAWCGGYGSTRTDGSGQPVTPDTPFLWASVSKLVTATAAGIAMEAGDLSFNSDVDELLSIRVEHPDTSRPIRVDALLAHVGGIKDNDPVMDDYYDRDIDPRMSLDEVVQRYFDPDGADYHAQRNFVTAGPEAQSRYSNMGYALAGAAVGSATDSDFADYTAEQIFGPLGMAHTSWRLSDFELDQLAEPTSWNGGDWVGHGHTTFADYPNGGLRSSAHDMACFTAWAARGGNLYGTRLLETDTLHHMMAPAFADLDPSQGLGWYYEDLGERKPWIGHSGGEAGVAADLFMRQDGSLGIVLVANGDWGREQPILDIEDALLAFARDL